MRKLVTIFYDFGNVLGTPRTSIWEPVGVQNGSKTRNWSQLGTQAFVGTGLVIWVDTVIFPTSALDSASSNNNIILLTYICILVLAGTLLCIGQGSHNIDIEEI